MCVIIYCKMLGFFKKTIQIFLMLVAFFAVDNIVLAQESVSDSLASINLNIFPYNPRAGDSVVFTLSSDSLDLDTSKILWYVDGMLKKDIATKNLTVKTKNNGQITTVRVVVETSDGIIKEATREISPAGVDLIIEPMSYTMPFYQGKPLLIGLGVVKIIAIPDVMIDGVKKSSKDLTFKWTRGGTVLGSSSGKGQSSVVINSTIPVRDINVGVQILDDSGNILASNSKIIVVNDPTVLFFEDSPLYGILYNKNITGNYYLGTREELKIVAKPFSFNFSKDVSNESSYAWYVNGNYVAPNGKANELIMRQTSTNLKGTASISLDLKNINKINQYANGSFNVEFGQ